ncbi:MAG: hypothetical protein H0V44_11055 [Planctomycetes bacterium]|nr:hypothetical protein [Planctomycetota bacterium]
MDQRWRVVITTVDGRNLLWRKNDRVHSLSQELGPVWVANFRPAVFQVLPDGALVPRGSAAEAADVANVALEPDGAG